MAVRQAILEAGLFDENLRRCEDFDLWLRRGARMTFTRNIQGYHRLANGLAGNPILIKQGRADAYRKAGLVPNITVSQRQTIQRKISEIEHEIQVEIIKELLLSGRYDDSRRAAQQAARTAPTWKLRATVIGLRFFPSLVQKLYRLHLQHVSRQKRAESVRKLSEAGSFDLEHFEKAASGSRSESAIG